MTSFLTPVQAILAHSAKTPDKIFLRQPIDGKLVDFTWSQVEDQCRRIASSLHTLGMKKGDHIAILSKNCAEWVMADWAIQMAGMVSVPMYPTANQDTIEHALKHSDSKAIFIGKLDDWKSQEPAISPELLRIAMPYPTMACQLNWKELIAVHEPIAEVHQPDPEELMSILYTSGSTGVAKGVLMSYRAYHYAGTTNQSHIGLDENERLISYLPLAHITERAVILAPCVYAGATLYFVESLDTFQRDLKTAEPTCFLSVPRLWTKFQSGVHAKLPPKKLRILLSIPLLGNVVAKKIRTELGFSSCRLFGSGTAPISPAVLKWYRRLGIDISEGWGMTETAGLSCLNYPYDERGLGSIGSPLPQTEMTLSQEGEILIKGPGLFSGYYKQSDLTAECFTEDGFFHTGDKGIWDSQLHNYRITGRVKDLFKTQKGKYVAPVPIESALSGNDLVEQVCVMGSDLPQPVAVVVLSEVAQQTPRADVRVSLETSLTTLNQHLESHERISHIVIAQEEWTIENGLLTPTMKIKRDLLEAKYQAASNKAADQTVSWE